MITKTEAVKEWRRNTKLKLVACMGSKCQICSYNRCMNALEFHHLNPNEKEFGLGAVRANPKNWVSIVSEMQKCILLCSNCHKEIHAGLINIPENFQTFDETLLEKEEAFLLVFDSLFNEYKNSIPFNLKITIQKHNKNIFDKNSSYNNLDLLEVTEEKSNTIYVSEIKDSEWDIVKDFLQNNIFSEIN